MGVSEDRGLSLFRTAGSLAAPEHGDGRQGDLACVNRIPRVSGLARKPEVLAGARSGRGGLG